MRFQPTSWRGLDKAGFESSLRERFGWYGRWTNPEDAEVRAANMPRVWLILCVLMMPLMLPSVLAAQGWEEDGWLTTPLAEERLALGDEFGCGSVPTLDWAADPGAVADWCRTYLSDRVDASRWGTAPLSIRTPSTLDLEAHERIDTVGFPVHGPETGLNRTVWHTASNGPTTAEAWWDLGERGGSLESGIADLAEVQQEVAAGGLVNLRWQGVFDGTSARDDGEVHAWLDAQTAWFTTWGEAWSYWVRRECTLPTLNQTMDNGSFGIELSSRSAGCDPRAWDVPVTWFLSGLGDADVLPANTTLLGSDAPRADTGVTQIDGGLLVSVRTSEPVRFNLSGDATLSVVNATEFWNGHVVAITIAGHRTTDLFKWSKGVDHGENLLFTWLVEPRAVQSSTSLLLVSGMVVLVLSVAGLRKVLSMDAKASSEGREEDGTS